MALISTQLGNLRRRGTLTFLAFALVTAVALARWLVLPWYFNPYVRLPSSTFSLSLQCVPSQLSIDSLTSYASLRKAQLVISDAQSHKILGAYDIPVGSSPPDSAKPLSLIVPRDEEAKASSVFGQNATAMMTFQFSRVPSLDLSGVHITYLDQRTSGACGSEDLTGSDLKKRLLGTSPRTMSFALIQDKLSDFLLKANELGGNLLLCALVVAFFWMATWVGWGFTATYLLSDRALMRTVSQSDPAALPSAQKKELSTHIKSQYSKVYRRLAFARVVGPATGFLLTVTSLVAGLHPSVVAAQDTFHFISSLQLALVATFMGLAVRIAAEFAIRLQRDAALRKLDLIG